MKIGLVLSGGGIRGIAHLGVLKALKEKNIEIAYISGTSAGAIAGALFANQVDPYDALRIFQSTRLLRLLKFAYGKFALLNIESSYKLFKDYLPHDSFDQLKIPLTVTASNLNNGELTYFNHGENLIKKVLASCCIPGVFNPILIDNSFYVDGGVLNNFPIEPLAQQCDYIIGSSCNHLSPTKEIRSFRHILERTATLAVNHNIEKKIHQVNLLIQPKNMGNIGLFEIGRAEEIYWIAHELTLNKLSEAGLGK